MQRPYPAIHWNQSLSTVTVLAVALLWRVIVLSTGTVTFHSDEAIVGLMARHINLGQPIPTFFYGQPYMGSLDALLVAGAFRVFGESVLAIRIPQLALYLGFVATTMLLANRVADQRTQVMAGLLVALGAPVVVLYTTMTLGGYGELLLLGNVALIAGWEIGRSGKPLWLWALLGAAVGLGWWTHGLIVTYALGVGAWLLIQRRLTLRGVLLAAVGFIALSLPWWVYQLANDWESVRFLLGGFAGSTVSPVSVPDKLIGLLLIGVPGLVGARYSWESGLWSPLGWLAVVAWVVMVVKPTPVNDQVQMRRGARRYLWLIVAAFTVVFLFSSFGVDATGRYLLPLVTPLVILLAMGTRGRIGTVVVVALIASQVVGVINAIGKQPPGLTPQFDPATDMPNTDDPALIQFLSKRELRLGYSTYWVSYRIAFLSGEGIILAPVLPYDADLRRVGTDRYPAYTKQVQQAGARVIVTANNAALDRVIEEALNRAGRWAVEQIGLYRVYYDLPTNFAVPAFATEGR
jgi:4-amino-4-deoxy-L-arabinose transferase-like glycosyltransferase